MSNDNPFFLLRTLWGALRHADWDAAAQRGLFALVIEFFRTLLGFSAWPFFIEIESDWRPSAVRQILDAHGIESWGWGRQGSEFFFQVRLRQATWAQYLLQQHAVPISGQLLDEGKRSAYRPGPRRTLRPTPGASRTLHSNTPGIARTGIANSSTAHTPKPTASAVLRDPVGEINNVIDRLAKW
jgi:hypothetical protein